MLKVFCGMSLLVLGGCQSLPSMQYCQQVTYQRHGNLIHIEASCQAPMGDIVSMPGAGVLK